MLEGEKGTVAEGKYQGKALLNRAHGKPGGAFVSARKGPPELNTNFNKKLGESPGRARGGRVRAKKTFQKTHGGGKRPLFSHVPQKKKKDGATTLGKKGKRLFVKKRLEGGGGEATGRTGRQETLPGGKTPPLEGAEKDHSQPDRLWMEKRSSKRLGGRSCILRAWCPKRLTPLGCQGKRKKKRRASSSRDVAEMW